MIPVDEGEGGDESGDEGGGDIEGGDFVSGKLTIGAKIGELQQRLSSSAFPNNTSNQSLSV